MVKAHKKIKRDFNVCNFNRTILTSERIETKSVPFISMLLGGGKDNKAGYSFFSKANFVVMASSHLAMLSYSQFRGCWNNGLSNQTCL